MKLCRKSEVNWLNPRQASKLLSGFTLTSTGREVGQADGSSGWSIDSGKVEIPQAAHVRGQSQIGESIAPEIQIPEAAEATEAKKGWSSIVRKQKFLQPLRPIGRVKSFQSFPVQVQGNQVAQP